MATPSGPAPSMSARTSGPWPGSARTARKRRPGSAEKPLEPPGPAGVGQPLLRVLALIALEALPVVGEPPGQPYLAGEQARGLVARGGLGLVEVRAQVRRQLGHVDVPQPREQGARAGLELGAIGGAGALGRGASRGRAQIHHELERGHLHGFLDALDQPARIAVLVREGAAQRPLAHGAANMRLRPAARGSGWRPSSAKKREGSVTLSSSSMMSWSVESG